MLFSAAIVPITHDKCRQTLLNYEGLCSNYVLVHLHKCTQGMHCKCIPLPQGLTMQRPRAAYVYM